MKKWCFILFTFIFYSFICFSQNKQIDSLKRELVIAKEDTSKVKKLEELSSMCLEIMDYKTAMECANQSLSLSVKLNYKKGVAGSYSLIGRVHFAKIKYAVALKYYKESLKISYTIGDKALIGHSYHDIGRVYYMQDNDYESLKYYYLALKQFEEINDVKMTGRVMGNIGAAYYYIQNYPEALKNYETALNLSQKADDKHYIAYAIKNIAVIYFAQANEIYMTGDILSAKNKYAAAIQNHGIAVKMYEEAGDNLGLMETYPNLGNVYEKLGLIARSDNDIQSVEKNFSLALQNYFSFLRLAEKFKDENYISEACNNLGSIYIKLKNFPRAKEYLNKGLEISKKIGFKVNMKDGYRNLADLYATQANFEQAYKNYKMFILYRDSLVNDEKTKKSLQAKSQYDLDKKEDQIKLLSTQNKLQTALAQQENQQKNFAYAGIGAMLLAGSYGFYRYRRRKKLQSKQAILKERLRISSELHDEVGATLSGIAMYSHLTKEQLKTGQVTEIEKSLNVMQQSSVQMVDKLNDIVWLINPEQDSLQKLIERLEEYATEMAAIKNMKVKISMPEKMADMNLPVESRRNIYLFCKEAINNAVKYSNATILELTVKEVNGKLEFSVSDNGRGFDAVMVRRGNGLENMQKRADEIGAKLLLQSKENEGASVSLQCKIT